VAATDNWRKLIETIASRGAVHDEYVALIEEGQRRRLERLLRHLRKKEPDDGS
jgi:hypothetical protein